MQILRFCFIPAKLTCTKYVEGAKTNFFKPFYSPYSNFYSSDQKVLIHLFKLHVLSLYDVETWFMKLHRKYLIYISSAYQKDIKRMCNKIL